MLLKRTKHLYLFIHTECLIEAIMTSDWVKHNYIYQPCYLYHLLNTVNINKYSPLTLSTLEVPASGPGWISYCIIPKVNTKGAF